MDCIRNHLRIWNSWSVIVGIVLGLFVPAVGHAAFASRFSLLVGEEYNDNIFFSKEKEHDFVTIITPTLTFLYAPAGQIAPTFKLDVSPSAYFFARHSDANSFGDDLSLNGAYNYQYSPRLNFRISNTLERLGETRVAGDLDDGGIQLRSTPTALPPIDASAPQSSSENLDLRGFVSRGDQITNSFSALGTFLYRPDIRFTGGYTNSYVKFIDAEGSDIFHTVGIRGIYNWRQEHNLHAGYSLSVGESRDGDTSIIHTFDLGDDYFSNYQIRLSPTLTLAASTGISLNTGSGGPRVANNTRVTVTKIWETATLTGGVRKGLTPSFGVSGIADTTSLFSSFRMQITERLTGNAGAEFSLYDTQDVNFNTLRASLGLQYLITSWLSSRLVYRHRWIDSGAGADSSELLDRGKVAGNSAFLSVTAHFDIWPRISLARSMTASSLSPLVTPPFQSPTPPITTPPQP
jgi:hypothetical protein